jgi:hypothetical protein
VAEKLLKAAKTKSKMRGGGGKWRKCSGSYGVAAAALAAACRKLAYSGENGIGVASKWRKKAKA